ncbi:MAG: 2Fe-2S iron-sulfur cluster-binding protein [Gemmobacter sp.]
MTAPSSGRNWSAAPWSDAEPLECAMVVPECADVATFTFRAPSGAWFDYLPGQFLTLELPLPGGPLHRTYTMSSSPSRPLSISVTVKAQPGSTGTRWMLDHLRPGMRLRAIGPAGLFSFQNHPARKYLFISAGSGITPMMSMTTWAWDSGEMPDIVFVHAARRPADIIFRRRLEGFAARVPGLQLRFTVRDVDPFEIWHGYRGRLNQLMLGLMAPDYLEREAFCCGPEPFMQGVREMLAAMGHDMARYHQESFAAPVRSAAEAPMLPPAGPAADTGAELRFARAGRAVPCRAEETVLAVARRAGLNIPSGCTFGLCGTCKVQKLSGDVHMVHNGGITEDEIARGLILACCAHPLGPVEIEL